MEEQWWRLFETDFDALSYELQRYLYDSFYNFAYKEIIFLLKDHSLVEDIIQESFLKATKKRHQLKDLASGKSWAKRIIHNHMIDTVKSKKKRHWTSLESVYYTNKLSDSELSSDVSVEEAIEVSLRNQVLKETIMELKTNHREVLLKYYMEEKSYKEIANELGISEQVITQRLTRARKALLSKFSRKWVDDNE